MTLNAFKAFDDARFPREEPTGQIPEGGGRVNLERRVTEQEIDANNADL